MKLYLVRHAEAVEKSGGMTDATRHLTPEGRISFRESARQLDRQGASLDFIFSSPLVRAVQTAEILAEEIGFRGKLVVTETLAPGFGRPGFGSVLSKCEGANEVALVGHEPDLGDLVTSLLALPEPRALKKGEIVALEFPRNGSLSPAVLLWSAAGKTIVD